MDVRKTPDPKILSEMVRRILETAHPLRIILFGSAARGEMGEPLLFPPFLSSL